MRRTHAQHHRLAFTLTELLVAIGIIAILIGILLPALGAITQRSRRAATLALMQQFADSCSHFQQQVGYLPGIIPEDVLAFDAEQNGGVARLSGTENALLHLMGGGVRSDDVDAATWAGLTAGNGWVTLSFQRPPVGTLDLKVNVNGMSNGRRNRLRSEHRRPARTAGPSRLMGSADHLHPRGARHRSTRG